MIKAVESPAPENKSLVKAEAPYENVTAIQTKAEEKTQEKDNIEDMAFEKDGIVYQIVKEFELDENNEIEPQFFAMVKDGRKISKKKINIPNTVEYNGTEYKVYAISKNAFSGNKKIRSVILGKNIERIEKNAFKGCKKLKKVTFKGNKVKFIGESAFKKTKKGITFKIPKKKAYKKLLKGKVGKGFKTK